MLKKRPIAKLRAHPTTERRTTKLSGICFATTDYPTKQINILASKESGMVATPLPERVSSMRQKLQACLS